MMTSPIPVVAITRHGPGIFWVDPGLPPIVRMPLPETLPATWWMPMRPNATMRIRYRMFRLLTFATDNPDWAPHALTPQRWGDHLWEVPVYVEEM